MKGQVQVRRGVGARRGHRRRTQERCSVHGGGSYQLSAVSIQLSGFGMGEEGGIFKYEGYWQMHCTGEINPNIYPF